MPASAPGRPPAIALRGITKRFGLNLANDAIDLVVEAGTIHGLVGENGAGKSTLMSILFGLYEADEGSIAIDGVVTRIARPEDAIAAGIGMVHQHFMLVETFTVLENLLLGVEGGPTLGRGRERVRSEAAALEAAYGLEVDLGAMVGDLPVGLQQRVEILKALLKGARVLVLDEPTAVLTPQEADHLFRILRALKEQGRTVVLITHKLREVMAVTDAVSVMRRGRMVATVATASTSREALAEAMVGRAIGGRAVKTRAAPGAPVLVIEDLEVADDAGIARVKGVSLTVRAGEIVGIAGVAGNGQSELLEAASGMRMPCAGRIRLEGAAVPDARSARSQGLAHVPEDRLRMGLVKGFAASENAILGYQALPRYGKGVFLSPASVRETARRWMAQYDVRPQSPDQDAASFSGGNQQKLVLAREIEHGPLLLLVGQPTRGVDIGATQQIHARIVAMRDAGKAVLLVSVELEEIMALADRILVMCDGRITGELDAADADERRLGLLMAGIGAEAA